MQIFALSGLINGIVAGIFALLVIFRNWRDKANQIYFLMSVSLAIWSFSYWQWLLSNNYGEALFWVRSLSIGSLFIPILFFHWVKLLIGNTKINNIILCVSYIYAICILFFVNTPYFISSLHHKCIFLFWPTAGIAYHIYFFCIYLGLTAYTLYLLIKAYLKTTEKDRRGQITFISLGAIIGFGGGLTNFPLWFEIHILPYGNFFIAIFPLFLGYSVLRHKLFNIKIIAIEFIIFALWIIILIRTSLAENLREASIESGLFIISLIFGIFLIRSIIHINSLNATLAQKVAEQTAEIRQAYEAEKKARQDLEKLNDAKNQFITLTQHHLRAPATDITYGLDSILAGTYGFVASGLRTAVKGMRTSAERLTRLVNDFLNITTLKAGRGILDISSTSLKPAIVDILEELRGDIEKMGLKASYPQNDPAWPILSIDFAKMREILFIVIDNAVRYNRQGGSVKISTSYGRM